VKLKVLVQSFEDLSKDLAANSSTHLNSILFLWSVLKASVCKYKPRATDALKDSVHQENTAVPVSMTRLLAP
jgi:hypothetical protein